VAKATELGGSLQMEANDRPAIGRIAGLTDPYGAASNVAALATYQRAAGREASRPVMLEWRL
jgi:hypothetical protein